MSLAELGRSVEEQFTQAFGRPPRWVAAAPGRVNVIGEHTDYNDGFVFPMAIERYTVIAAAPSEGSVIELRSTAEKVPAKIDLAQQLHPQHRGTWYNYPLGVIAGFQARGTKIGAFQALIHSTVPLGGGLSSSAAL
jgi:galactokinase